MAAVTQLNRDNGWENAPGWVDCRSITTSAESHTVPTGARYVRIAGNLIFYVNMTGTAAVPAADVTNGGASEVIPPNTVMMRRLEGVSAISLIAPAATLVTLSFYS
jgi:hypothetical protein